jgi:hypothetical protein
MEVTYNRQGTKTKLIGFIIMVLGTLDLLLNLRGGLPAYENYILLIFAGACVFAIGTVRGRKRPSAEVSEV